MTGSENITKWCKKNRFRNDKIWTRTIQIRGESGSSTLLTVPRILRSTIPELCYCLGPSPCPPPPCCSTRTGASLPWTPTSSPARYTGNSQGWLFLGKVVLNVKEHKFLSYQKLLPCIIMYYDVFNLFYRCSRLLTVDSSPLLVTATRLLLLLLMMPLLPKRIMLWSHGSLPPPPLLLPGRNWQFTGT